MKPLIEKLPLKENASFVVNTHRTPYFEVPWHQHVEYELILLTEGEGQSFIGNDVGEFTVGDIFFLGSNLPHTFQKANKELITSAIVVHFREDFWGNELLQLPESRSIKKLLATSAKGLKITGTTKAVLEAMIHELYAATGFESIIKLCSCLQLMATTQSFETVSTQEIKELNVKNKERIDKIFQYTIDNFQEPVTLTKVAKHAGMSMPAFCNYFKKSTRKTYIDFLNEVRIGYACKQMVDTPKTIESICYESGFNTLANFNKQFLKVKKMPPSKYRKRFAEGVV